MDAKLEFLSAARWVVCCPSPWQFEFVSTLPDFVVTLRFRLNFFSSEPFDRMKCMYLTYASNFCRLYLPQIEWEKRWKTFPEKFATALVKYHAVTLILRSYEYIASKIVHLHRLDKLTTDPFAMSKRLAAKQKERTASDKNERIETTVYMTQTALWANLLPFFADYSLHQGLLCYGYYRYYTYRRQQRIEEASTPADADELEETIESEEEAAAEETRALGRDLVTRSSRLASNRGLGWIGTAVGSGIGSVIWPGWGTLVVSSFGDVVAGAILDDGYNATTKKLEDRRTAGAADEEKEEDGNGLSQ
mmetsp:Transcript_2332/g.5170  ORF Transcript_2332/g.5170 Transcript_2332/m.5170 type:complete len:305 (+) Transcript_2332:1617-2531(+)